MLLVFVNPETIRLGKKEVIRGDKGEVGRKSGETRGDVGRKERGAHVIYWTYWFILRSGYGIAILCSPIGEQNEEGESVCI